MNPTGKKSPGAGGVPQPFNRQTGHAPQSKPVVAQPKTAVSAPSVRRPVAPPAYHSQQVPKVLQTKSSSAPSPQAGQASRQPVAPPAHRPEAKKLIQPKAVAPQRMSPTASPAYRPAQKRIAQPEPAAVTPAHMLPKAPPVNRSQQQPRQVNAQSGQSAQMKKAADAGREHPHKKTAGQSGSVKAISGDTVQLAPSRAASREANRRMGLDARGRGRVRVRRQAIRYRPPPAGQYGYFWKAVRVNDAWAFWRVLEPGARAIFHTGLMPYQGSRLADYAHANGLHGMPQPPGTVWHHVHDWRIGGGPHGRGSLALMLVGDHNRFHRGGVEQYNRHRHTVGVYV